MPLPEEDAPLAPEAIAALLRFLPVFESPGFHAGEWHGGKADAEGVIHMPWFELSPDASAFVSELGRQGWIVVFDWPAWLPEAQRLVEGDGVEHADVPALRRLFTLLVRHDRFSEGTLAWAMESGLVLRMLQRLRDVAP